MRRDEQTTYIMTRPSRVDLIAQDNRRWLRHVVEGLRAEYRDASWDTVWGQPWLQETASVALYLLIVLAALSLPIWAT